MKIIQKMKHAARSTAIRMGMDNWRIGRAQKRGKDILIDGNWLCRRIRLKPEIYGAFPQRIQNTNLKAWNVRPVDTWRREQQLEDMVKQYRFCYDAMLIVRNPYGLTPLAALCLFDTEEACYVRYTVRGRDRKSVV